MGALTPAAIIWQNVTAPPVHTGVKTENHKSKHGHTKKNMQEETQSMSHRSRAGVIPHQSWLLLNFMGKE